MTKSVTIGEKTHSRIKKYCDDNALKITKYIPMIINKHLDEIENNNKITQ